MKKRIISMLLMCGLALTLTIPTVAKERIKSTDIDITADSVTLTVGDIASLSGVMIPQNSTDKIKWSVNKKDIAKVNKYGVVTALKEGKVKVTAKTSSGATDICTVNVKKELSEEDIVKLIQDNTLSEDKVKEIVAANSYSEEDIKKLIEKYAPKSTTTYVSSGGSSGVSSTEVRNIVKQMFEENNVVTEGNWEDGTEVLSYGTTFPLTDRDNKCTITSVSIKKYHNTSELYSNGRKYKYKYVREITGTWNISYSDFLNDSMEINFDFMDKNGYTVSYANSDTGIQCNDTCDYIDHTGCEIDGQNFKHVEVYYNYNDCDCYRIMNLRYMDGTEM